MKSIVLLVAIFAIARAGISPWDVYHGFSTKMGLTAEQQQGFQDCAIELRDNLAPYLSGGKAAAEARLLGFLMADDAKHRETVIAILEKAQTSLPKCKQFITDVYSAFAKAHLSAEEHHIPSKHLIQYRFSKYADLIYSTLFKVYFANTNRNGTALGEYAAELIQLMTGINHPESVYDYALKKMNENNGEIEVQVMETDRLIQQTINNAAKELGSDKQVTEEQIRELKLSVLKLVQIFTEAQFNLHHSSSVIEREVTLIGATRDLIKAAGTVKDNAETILRVFFPKSQNSGPVDPRHRRFNFTWKHISMYLGLQYVKNMPTVARRQVDLVLAIQKHHPVAAGKALAGLFKTIVYPNPN